MPLIIVESPNKIKSIKSSLDDTYEVISSVGHIMDLEKKNMGIKIPEFEPVYTDYKEKKDVIANIKAKAREHDEIYIATDADREGEAIAFNIKSLIPKNKKVHRVVFKEINKKEVLIGLKNKLIFNEDLYNSQMGRRMTDRIVGFKISPVMWTKGLKNTSAGRVQSAALKILVDREKEVRAFKKEEYWSIKADLGTFLADFVSVSKNKVIPKTEQETNKIIAAIGNKLKVTAYTAKERQRQPAPPFETATLQQDAGSRLSWTGKRTMDVAQSLFSQGHITYHRTDSVRCDPEKIQYIRGEITREHGAQYVPDKPIVYSAGDEAQDAHECIRPTFYTIPSLTGDEAKLYNLILDRFTASQMSNAVFEQAAMELDGNDHQFKANGSVMKFDGFLKVYGSAKDDVSIPPTSKNTVFNIEKLIPTQHFTQPPKRYTGPSLTAKLKKEGIGRPSTYAVIDETLVKKGYAERKSGTMIPTEIGIMICDYLDVYFPNLTDSKFTANMEATLDQVEKGKINLKDLMTKFYDDLLKEIEVAKTKNTDVFAVDIDCKLCSSKMRKKISANGVFYGCSSYPECGHIINIGEEGQLIESSTETSVPCPLCSSPTREIKGKNGTFHGCTAYPTCKWTGKIENGEVVKREVSEYNCPECSSPLVERGKPSNRFYGCSSYPKCKVTMSIGKDKEPIKTQKKEQKKTGEDCPKCSSPLIERKGKFGNFIACSGYPKCKHIKK